jgi:hypothetical protein
MRVSSRHAALAACAALTAFAAPAAAQDALALEPAPTSATMNDGVPYAEVTNYTGRCGAATVRVIGIEELPGEWFSLDPDGRIIVRNSAGRALTIEARDERVLYALNRLHCAHRGGRAFVVIWTQCALEHCGHDWAFRVIDADAPRLLDTRRCDDACLLRLTGERRPDVMPRI